MLRFNQFCKRVFSDCQELIITGCSRGYLTGRNILLHASMRCKNLTSLDASWCDVEDNGVMAMSDASPGYVNFDMYTVRTCSPVHVHDALVCIF